MIMGRCPSRTEIPNVRGRKDAEGKVIMVTVRCEEGAEGHEGLHHNGHENDGKTHTLEWGE